MVSVSFTWVLVETMSTKIHRLSTEYICDLANIATFNCYFGSRNMFVNAGFSNWFFFLIMVPKHVLNGWKFQTCFYWLKIFKAHWNKGLLLFEDIFSRYLSYKLPKSRKDLRGQHSCISREITFLYFIGLRLQ